MYHFKERLRELREEAGLSMQQLASEIEVSNAAVCKWENGTAEPKVCYLIKLAEYFNCTIDYLVGKTDDFSFATELQSPPSLKLTVKEKQLIGSYRDLNPNMKNLIQETVYAWNNLCKADREN
jgi:transcriptional regulator with XRE-family HTH domain